MPAGSVHRPEDDLFISELFQQEYANLIRYARIAFQRTGGYVDPQGRAEEIVQETFFLALEKREELQAREDRQKWLIAAVSYKVREALREDRKWTRGLLLLPSEDEAVPFAEPEEPFAGLSKEDYHLLRQVYVEGYTYQELCEQLGLSKSALAMRISRIKKAAQKKMNEISEKV